jgi:hypothetical protein
MSLAARDPELPVYNLGYEVKYNNGLKWNRDYLTENIDVQVNRTRHNHASVIVIDGLYGQGKTTLGVEIGEYISHQHFKTSFDIDNQVGKGINSFLEKLNWCIANDKHVCVFDEAGEFSKKGSMTKLNKLLNRVFEVFRATGIILIICIPSVQDLDDSQLKKGLVRFLINCFGRTDKPYSKFRVYDIERIFYIKHYMSKEVVPAKGYSKVHPNFQGYFKDLDESTRKELQLLDLKDKKGILKDKYFEAKGLIDVNTIIQETGFAYHTVLNKLKTLQAPFEKHGNKNYYFKSVINRFNARQRHSKQ